MKLDESYFKGIDTDDESTEDVSSRIDKSHFLLCFRQVYYEENYFDEEFCDYISDIASSYKSVYYAMCDSAYDMADSNKWFALGLLVNKVDMFEILNIYCVVYNALSKVKKMMSFGTVIALDDGKKSEIIPPEVTMWRYIFDAKNTPLKKQKANEEMARRYEVICDNFVEAFDDTDIDLDDIHRQLDRFFGYMTPYYYLIDNIVDIKMLKDLKNPELLEILENVKLKESAYTYPNMGYPDATYIVYDDDWGAYKQRDRVIKPSKAMMSEIVEKDPIRWKYTYAFKSSDYFFILGDYGSYVSATSCYSVVLVIQICLKYKDEAYIKYENKVFDSLGLNSDEHKRFIAAIKRLKKQK